MPRKLPKLADKTLVYATCAGPPAEYCALEPDAAGPQAELEHDLLTCALDEAVPDPYAVRDDKAFKEVRDRALQAVGRHLEEIYGYVAETLDLYLTYQRLRARVDGPGRIDALRDTDEQLARMVPRRFVAWYTAAELKQLPRYVRGAMVRLESLDRDARKDTARLAEVLSVERPAMGFLKDAGPGWRRRPELVELRWQLEELRLSVFAQSIRTRAPVSVKRVQRRLAEL